jgi:hypothetical protein
MVKKFYDRELNDYPRDRDFLLPKRLIDCLYSINFQTLNLLSHTFSIGILFFYLAKSITGVYKVFERYFLSIK